jgi:outer membrane lipoprotein-sorting protein
LIQNAQKNVPARDIRIGTSPPSDPPGAAAPAVTAYIGAMNTLARLFAPLAFLAMTLPAMAEKIPLNTLSNYLNGLTTLEADFTQVNADGTVSTGKIYIKRPGRVRFEYGPPDKSLVLASAGTVAIFDAKSNQPPERYPLERTPLNLILGANIDLSAAQMVVAHQEDGTATKVVAQDPKHPEYGTIALMFTADPVELRQWVITDDLGAETTVILGAMTKGTSYQPSFFNIDTEIAKRGL